MVVVILVGVLVTLAIPAISTQVRDRRTNQAAHEVAMLYRQARSLAMGRGSAVMVHFDATGQGRLDMREAQSVTMGSGGCQTRLPATSCAVDWDAASTQNRLVAGFDPSTNGVYSNVQFAFFQASGVAAGGIVDICFTPLGRPYRRLVAAGAFDVMNEVPYVTVTPIDGAGITRRVLIVPTGASRLAL
jgi:Tfp pilus assembly protein FimT